jgi:hypothetical protein
MFEQAFDCVIVGGGSAGDVIANRLGEDAKTSVAALMCRGVTEWFAAESSTPLCSCVQAEASGRPSPSPALALTPSGVMSWNLA